MTARFASAADSHSHSLRTLNTLYEFDDFMQNIRHLVDMGCGSGQDLEWWATRTTREHDPTPLNIRCLGIDLPQTLNIADRHRNITYRSQDFEQDLPPQKHLFDVIWCHDSFQFVVDPFATLARWKRLLTPHGAMVLIVPQSTNLEFNRQAYDQIDGVYWNWTVVSLMHVLATAGWNCAQGHWLKDPTDPWIHVMLYNTPDQPRNPRTTRWFDLVEAGMLPESAEMSIRRHGYLRQRDLVLKWVDGSNRSMAAI